MNPEHKIRSVAELIQATPASDGDGVRLLRVFGGQDLARFDPFLMLDEFGSYDARDYIGGFPPHPHRGFETVTYMLEGKMEHRDHMQNVGLLEAGDVQWMKAGAGIIHSEMPRQQEGRMRGFQLWVNLPAREKMTPATYEDIPAARIPVYRLGDATARAIAGSLQSGATLVEGAVQGKATEAGYLDLVADPGGAELDILVPDGHTALLYVYEGEVFVGDPAVRVAARRLARLSREGRVAIKAGPASRMLLITGRPIGEPIVHYGPFVMNTEAEIQQALEDYRHGRLAGAVGASG